MNKHFVDAVCWKYSKLLKDSYEPLLKEFSRFPCWLYNANGEYKIDTSGQWNFIMFMRKGKKNFFNLMFFPTVRKLMEDIPIFDNCMFSIIGPDTHIPSHDGHSDQHFRVHLGLTTDGQSWIRVGDETRYWKNQEILIFNDRDNHEVKNPSNLNRVVFLFDIKRQDYYANI